MAAQQRGLKAIMFTDIVGYTSLMGDDVEFGISLVHKNRMIQKPLVEKHHGQWLKEMGDGVLAQFDTALDAVRCSLEIQKSARDNLNAQLRIGIHLSDVILEEHDIFGDGVNIASRVQAAADPGGIYITEAVYKAIRARKEIKTALLGDIWLKNVNYPVCTYYLCGEGLPEPSKSKIRRLTRAPGKKLKKSLSLVFLVILLLAAVLTGWWQIGRDGPHIQSLAILPIENISGKVEEAWLEAGIHHELIDAIGKLHGVRVISRTSVMKYLNSSLSIPEIAEELNVDGIVEGSFLKSGDSLNVRVRLIQARPEEMQLWNQEYEKPMKNVLAVYNDVARDIANEVKITLTAQEEALLSSQEEIDPRAYEAYLRGMSQSEILSRESLDKAMDYFEEALKFEPDYALAYAGIAWVWGVRVQQGFLPHKTAWPKAREAAHRALRLDSTLVETHNLLALHLTWGEWEWEEAGREFRKALEINPNYAFSLAYYSHYLAIMGQAEKGLAFGRKSVAVDPLNSLYQAIYGMALKNAGHYEEAREVLQDLLESEPNERTALPTLWAVYHEQGEFDKALVAARKIYGLKNNTQALRALNSGFEEGGYHLAMQRTAEKMIALRDSGYITPWQIATLYARAGKLAESISWLDSAYLQHDANMPYISCDPLFDDMRNEAGFRELLKNMNLPD